MIEQWLEAKNNLAAAQKHERELRQKVIKALFDEPEYTEGSKTIEAEGYKVTAGFKLNRTLDLDRLIPVWDNIPDETRQAVLPVKPTLNLAAYRKVTGPDRALIDEAITTKPATTQLKVQEIK